MKTDVIAEIGFARKHLQLLTCCDRRRLLRKIIEALDGIDDDVATRHVIRDPIGLDRVILTTSESIGQIAIMKLEDFRAIIDEFDALFATLSQRLLLQKSLISHEIH